MNVYFETLGRKGIESAERIKPDVIIIDLGLPDITGIEVFKELTNLHFTRRPKFIFISGSIDLEELDDLKNEDIVVLQKPLRFDIFFKAIKMLIDAQT